MLPSFLRDSLWTVHREPQLQAHSPHTCQPPLPQSVLTPPIFVHGVSIFLIMSFQGAIPVVCGASTWLAWVPAAQYDWELGPGFAYPLFDTNFYSLNPILFRLLPLIGKKKTIAYCCFLSQATARGLLIYCLIHVCGSAGNWPVPFGDLWTRSLTAFNFHLEPKFYCQEEVMKFVIIPGVPSSSYSVVIVLQGAARGLFHGWIYISRNLESLVFVHICWIN